MASKQIERAAGAGLPRLEASFDGGLVGIGSLRFGAGSERQNGGTGGNETKCEACGERCPGVDPAGHCMCSSCPRRFVCPAGRSYFAPFNW